MQPVFLHSLFGCEIKTEEHGFHSRLSSPDVFVTRSTGAGIDGKEK